jgi:hypothetical protein
MAVSQWWPFRFDRKPTPKARSAGAHLNNQRSTVCTANCSVARKHITINQNGQEGAVVGREMKDRELLHVSAQ